MNAPHWAPELPLIGHNSMIVGPLDDALTGPIYNEDGLMLAQASTAKLPPARDDFDVVDHYAWLEMF